LTAGVPLGGAGCVANAGSPLGTAGTMTMKMIRSTRSTSIIGATLISDANFLVSPFVAVIAVIPFLPVRGEIESEFAVIARP
jgi:hypothetical protein